jgi:predicted metal-dependent phosphoesterase TrpH
VNIRFAKPDIDELRKEYMLVDMHFHSNYSGDCSTPVSQIIAQARKLGVQLALTDHNAIGGVLAAEKMAPGLVMPAIEICTTEGKEVIPYFYNVRELEAFYNRVVKPKLRMKSSLQSNTTNLLMEELLDELSRENCVVSIPHPFALPPRRNYAFFMKHRELLKHVHAVEVINQTMLHRQNLSSLGWGMQMDKALLAGSDGHVLPALGSAFTMAKAQNWEEFLNCVKRKQLVVVGEERLLRHQMVNAKNLLTEKAKIMKNFRSIRVE